jgi:glutathione S-transferase
MKLLMSPASPFVRKVRVLIREADLRDTVQEIEVTTHALAPDPTVVATNPTGKIPALVRTDGPAIYDSRVITRYLDAHANAGLYPEKRIWDVLTIEATADAIMDAAVLITYEARLRPPDKQFDGWTDGQWTKVIGGVSALNDRWMSQLSGPLDMGQISVGCALGYLDLRHDARGWRAKNTALAAWYTAFSERDSMTATAP